jgi:hypothetical protein
VGLYHRHGLTNGAVETESVDSEDFNATTNVITADNVTVPATGTPVVWDQFSMSVTELVNNRLYYTIKLTDTTFQLANSYADALDGNAIDFSAPGGGSSWLRFLVTKDYGDTAVDYGGSVLYAHASSDINHAQQVGPLFFAGKTLEDPTADNGRLFVTSNGIPNRGYITTPKLFADKEDAYPNLFLKYRPLDTGDEIRIKYRTNERHGLPVPRNGSGGQSQYEGTWSSSTVFTSTEDLSDVVPGDEVEVFGGVGAGHLAHVTDISESSGTYTVTLDEANDFAENTDTMLFFVDNWKLLETIDSNKHGTERAITLGKQGKFLQLKIELRGIGTTIEELTIDNTPSKT